MFVNVKSVQITFEDDELSCIAFALQRSLKMSVETHYKNHSLDVFQRQERAPMSLMCTVYGLIGQNGRGEEHIKELESTITEAQKTKSKS